MVLQKKHYWWSQAELDADFCSATQFQFDFRKTSQVFGDNSCVKGLSERLDTTICLFACLAHSRYSIYVSFVITIDQSIHLPGDVVTGMLISGQKNFRKIEWDLHITAPGEEGSFQTITPIANPPGGFRTGCAFVCLGFFSLFNQNISSKRAEGQFVLFMVVQCMTQPRMSHAQAQLLEGRLGKEPVLAE